MIRKWVIGGALLGAGAVVTYFSLPARTTVEPVALTVASPTVVVPTSVPTVPVILETVVDVTDIDPLLDPPAIPVSEPSTPAGASLTSVGYDEPAPVAARQSEVVKPIPRADESDELTVDVAPMPRVVR